jgi:3'-phosphoadenosine 5'-phosphosulfate (PAPS) 3'-phosphatase
MGAGGEGAVEHSTGLTVMNKDDASPVTVADRAAEAAMRNAIGVAFPSHGVYGEEAGMQGGGGEWVWVLDPIDGTKSFITGIHRPPARCIALDGGESVSATIATYDPRFAPCACRIASRRLGVFATLVLSAARLEPRQPCMCM